MQSNTAGKLDKRKMKKRKPLSLSKKSNLEFIIMNVPTILLIFVFAYLPLPGLILAFKDFKVNLGIWKSPMVGFENFEFLFRSKIAWRITKNTLLMNSIFIITGTTISVMMGVFLNELSKGFIRIYQTIMFIPYYLSWIVVGYLFLTMFDMELGLLNQLNEAMGREPILWYNEPKYWRGILTGANIWKTTGYGAILYYTAIMGIDDSLFEAAEIDGASRWQQIIHITIPLIKPTIIMLTLIALGRIIRADFGLFYFLPNESGALLPVTDVIDTYVFRTLRKIGDINMSSAAGLYQAFVGFGLVLAFNTIIRKVDRESAIF